MSHDVYNDFRLYFLLLNFVFLGYVKLKSGTLRTRSSKPGIFALALLWIVLCFYGYPLSTKQSLSNMASAFYEYVIVVGVPALHLYTYTARKGDIVEILRDLQAVDLQIRDLGLTRTSSFFHKLISLINTLALVFAFASPLMFFALVATMDELRNVLKIKFLFLVLFALLGMPVLMVSLIYVKCKTVNEALEDGLKTPEMKCVKCCNSWRVVLFKEMCPVHKLCSIEAIYLSLNAIFSHVLATFKIIQTAYIFVVIMEIGIDICNVTTMSVSNPILYLKQLFVVGFFMVLVVVGALIHTTTIDVAQAELARTSGIVHRYYMKFWRMGEIGRIIRRLTLIVLHPPKMQLFIYSLNKNDMANQFNTSAGIGSVAYTFRVRLI